MPDRIPISVRLTPRAFPSTIWGRWRLAGNRQREPKAARRLYRDLWRVSKPCISVLGGCRSVNSFGPRFLTQKTASRFLRWWKHPAYLISRRRTELPPVLRADNGQAGSYASRTDSQRRGPEVLVLYPKRPAKDHATADCSAVGASDTAVRLIGIYLIPGPLLHRAERENVRGN